MSREDWVRATAGGDPVLWRCWRAEMIAEVREPFEAIGEAAFSRMLKETGMVEADVPGWCGRAAWGRTVAWVLRTDRDG